MQPFNWATCFTTGIGELDALHQHLVDLVNRCGDILAMPTAGPRPDLEEAADQLSEHALRTFQQEEGLMERLQVDARHAEPHARAHARFLKEAGHFKNLVATEQWAQAHDLLSSLTRWLIYHILGEDLALARQVASIQEGHSPDEAFLADTSRKETASSALLLAVDGLFKQASQRTRELRQLNQTLEARVNQRTQELQKMNQRLENAARTDSLTRLPNRRQAMSHLQREWDSATQHQMPLSCVMIDVDEFKHVNDVYGLEAGDLVLRELSQRLPHLVRGDDVVCRLGGDEFLIICPGTPLDGAMILAEALRGAVAQMRVQVGSGVWEGSISVGVAERTSTMATMDELVKRADEGLFIAKRRGHNSIATIQGR